MKIINITQKEYRDIDALSNSDLQLIEVSPSNYKFAINAPQDTSKTSALDYGTALHAALLEPETFNSLVDVYSDTKTRETVKFSKYMDEREDDGKLVLLESEYDKLRFTVEGSQYHPQFASYINSATHKEASITCMYRGVMCKVRPDAMNIHFSDDGMGDLDSLLNWVADVKTTADIDDWRNSAEWKNPLFTHNYGFTAAFYMDVLAEAFQCEVNEYKFLVVQKTVNLGRYPVAVFTVTRDELERYGFFERVHAAIDTYKACYVSDNWMGEEVFPLFNDKFNSDVEISFGGDE